MDRLNNFVSKNMSRNERFFNTHLGNPLYDIVMIQLAPFRGGNPSTWHWYSGFLLLLFVTEHNDVDCRHRMLYSLH